jgi:hypothetical protein
MRLSTRRFQDHLFVCWAYDKLAKDEMRKAAYIKAAVSTTGTGTSVAEQLAGIQKEDVVLAAAYMDACGQAVKSGRDMPPKPAAASPAAIKLMKTIKHCVGYAEHTDERAARARVDQFAMSADFGKATWWFTFSPSFENEFDLFFIALGPDGVAREDVPPIATRFKVVAEAPGAAALYYERVLDTVIEEVFGWDLKKQAPKAKGGLFGIPICWSMCTEEQARKALHGHGLLTCVGHREILERLKRMKKQLLQRDCEHGDDVDNERCNICSDDYETLLERFRIVINDTIKCELPLDEDTLKDMTLCCNCGRSLELAVADADFVKLRERSSEDDPAILQCSDDDCRQKHSTSCKIRIVSHLRRCIAVLYNNLGLGDLPLTKEAAANARFSRCCQGTAAQQAARVAANALDTLGHDPKHRDTCFKCKRKDTNSTCHFELPTVPVNETEVSFDPTLPDETVESSDPLLTAGTTGDNLEVDVDGLELKPRQRAPFVYLTKGNGGVCQMMWCNHHLNYVYDQRVNYYWAAYATKPKNQETNARTAECLDGLQRFLDRTADESDRSDFSRGIGMVMSGVYHKTKSDSVGAPLCAHLVNGRNVFEFSHKFETLPVKQGVAYLDGEAIESRVCYGRAMVPSILNYVFRPRQSPNCSLDDAAGQDGNDERTRARPKWPLATFDHMTWWEFTAHWELVKATDLDIPLGDIMNQRATGRVSREWFALEEKHPRATTHVVRRRSHRVIPKLGGKRVPDRDEIFTTKYEELDDSQRKKIDEKRKWYAQALSIMLLPWRGKCDLLVKDSW